MRDKSSDMVKTETANVAETRQNVQSATEIVEPNQSAIHEQEITGDSEASMAGWQAGSGQVNAPPSDAFRDYEEALEQRHYDKVSPFPPYESPVFSPVGSLPPSEVVINAPEPVRQVTRDSAATVRSQSPSRSVPWLGGTATQMHASPLPHTMLYSQLNSSPLPLGFQPYVPVTPASQPLPSMPYAPSPFVSHAEAERRRGYEHNVQSPYPLPYSAPYPAPYPSPYPSPYSSPYSMQYPSPYGPTARPRPMQRRKEVYVARDPFQKWNKPKAKASHDPSNEHALAQPSYSAPGVKSPSYSSTLPASPSSSEGGYSPTSRADSPSSSAVPGLRTGAYLPPSHPASSASSSASSSTSPLSYNSKIPRIPDAPMHILPPQDPSDSEKQADPDRPARRGVSRVILENLQSWSQRALRWALPPRRDHLPPSQFEFYAQGERHGNTSASDGKSGVKYAVIEFTTQKVPTRLYLVFLLFLPSFYFSRVGQLFEEAELLMPEIEQMAIETSLQAQNFLDERVPGDQNVFPQQWTRLKSTWGDLVDALLGEWKTLNVVSALLLRCASILPYSLRPLFYADICLVPSLQFSRLTMLLTTI